MTRHTEAPRHRGRFKKGLSVSQCLGVSLSVTACLLIGSSLVAQDQPPVTFRGGTSLRVITVTEK